MKRNRRVSPQTAAVLLELATKGAAWSHGYDLCVKLGTKAGTMYPILIRLAERGQLETSWERDAPGGRPPRHLYRLSAAGVELVAELATGEVAHRDASRPRRGIRTAPA